MFSREYVEDTSVSCRQWFQQGQRGVQMEVPILMTFSRNDSVSDSDISESKKVNDVRMEFEQREVTLGDRKEY